VYEIIKNLKGKGANKNIKYLFILVAAGVLIVLKLIMSGNEQDYITGKIKRPEPGEDAKSVELDVYDENGNKQTTINTYIEPRKMSEEETDVCFDNAYEELISNMLKDNISTDCITKNLYMPDKLEDGLIYVSLYPSDYSVIDYDGTVHNELMEKEDIKEVAISYIMQYEEYDRQGIIKLTVRPIGAETYYRPDDNNVTDNDGKAIDSVLSGKSGQSTAQKVIDSSVNKDTTGSEAQLPDSIAGKNVYYGYSKEKTSYMAYIFLIAAVVALVVYKRKNKGVNEQKQRIKELQYDYSELIAKLTLLLGAGMTIRKAWQKMVDDYLKKKEAGGAVKAVYEEMYITDCHIKAGISEYEAYEEFGHRCGTREYLKLASLLQTNLKRGTKRLRELLYQESYDAFEQRKNLAKQKGEEATTRLLIPMIMMLLVVMVIIMFPAVMSFYLT
jgi:hypothetical protein